MRRLIKVFTVCLQEFQVQIEQKWKIHLTPLKLQMDSHIVLGWESPLGLFGLSKGDVKVEQLMIITG